MPCPGLDLKLEANFQYYLTYQTFLSVESYWLCVIILIGEMVDSDIAKEVRNQILLGMTHKEALCHSA
jgi:hypothetical protein